MFDLSKMETALPPLLRMLGFNDQARANILQAVNTVLATVDEINLRAKRSEAINVEVAKALGLDVAAIMKSVE